MSSSVSNNRVQNISVNNTDVQISVPSVSEEVSFERFVEGKPLSERDIQILNRFQNIELLNKHKRTESCITKSSPYILSTILGIFLVIFPFIMARDVPMEMVIVVTVGVAVGIFMMCKSYCNVVNRNRQFSQIQSECDKLRYELELEKIGRNLFDKYDELAKSMLIKHLHWVAVPTALINQGYDLGDLQFLGYKYSHRTEIINLKAQIKQIAEAIYDKKEINLKFLLDNKISKDWVKKIDTTLHSFTEILISQRTGFLNVFHEFCEVRFELIKRNLIQALTIPSSPCSLETPEPHSHVEFHRHGKHGHVSFRNQKESSVSSEEETSLSSRRSDNGYDQKDQKELKESPSLEDDRLSPIRSTVVRLSVENDTLPIPGSVTVVNETSHSST